MLYNGTVVILVLKTVRYANIYSQGPTANPTAPSLATMERGDVGEVSMSPTDTSFDRDPPFAPGHVGKKPDCLTESGPASDQTFAPTVPQRPGK